jgi:hypothetical protein
MKHASGKQADAGFEQPARKQRAIGCEPASTLFRE